DQKQKVFVRLKGATQPPAPVELPGKGPPVPVTFVTPAPVGDKAAQAAPLTGPMQIELLDEKGDAVLDQQRVTVAVDSPRNYVEAFAPTYLPKEKEFHVKVKATR